MSCTSPVCYLIPKYGGKPKPIGNDYPVGSHPLGRIVYLPCGGCIACRRERRQELTLLQCCEASLSEDNWFITLTYDDWKHLESEGLLPYSLCRNHISEFCEKMRKYCLYNGSKFRFFACGEYGERYERPHYHLSVFGLDSFLLGIADQDKLKADRLKGLNKFGKFYKLPILQKDSNGNPYWQSPVISERWKFGSHKIYRATRETFQYVAGYVTKKLTGEKGKVFRSTGRQSEFQLQSRPSIGKPWFDKYFDTISVPDRDRLVNDTLAIAGVSWKVPRIFEKWFLQLDHFDSPLILDRIKALRSIGQPELPDRKDLKRKADFDRYSAIRYQSKNLSHKEIQ